MEEELPNSYGLLLLAIAFSAFILLLRRLFSKASSRKPLCLPPSPLALPVIGHLHLLRQPFHQALHNLNARHGPLIHLRLGSTPCVTASTPDMARELLKSHDAAVSNRPQSVASRHFAYGAAGFAFAPYGPYWRFMKRLCMLELLGSRNVELLRPIRRAELLVLLRSAQHRARTREPLNLTWEVIRLTNNEVTRMAASTTSSAAGGEEEEARELVKQVAELVGAFNLADFIGLCRNLDVQGLKKRIVDVHDRFDALLERIIQSKEDMRRRKKEEAKIGGGSQGGGPEVKDLLDILLDVAEDENVEMKLSRENIKGFIMDIITAGSDSTAATIEWALAELINHPGDLRKVQDEIDRVVGKARIVDETDLPELPFLQAVVKESMRLHPAAPLVHRENYQDIKVAGYDIPAHTTIFVNLWSIGRDPAHWADPLEFRPERFLGQGDDGPRSAVDVKGQHFQLIPFGSGRRGCPGMALAIQVVGVTVAALVQCFDWEVSGGGDGDGKEKGRVDMEEGIGLVIGRAKPLDLVPVARLEPFPAFH